MENIEELPEWKTGDIVLFSGRCIVGKTIRLLSRSKWSHCGMIIIDPSYDYPLLYEATKNKTLACKDLGYGIGGVQLIPLYERIADYNGDIGIRQLEGIDLSDEALYSLYLFRKFMIGIEFEDNFMTFLAAIYPLPYTNRYGDIRKVFCTELIAQVYMEMGLLDRLPPSNKYAPSFFDEVRGNKLKKGYLGSEILIKLKGSK
tara:strand:- start:596 stop:1201 length:606 start_codon:yes stop_codon:yes gene_type:complete